MVHPFINRFVSKESADTPVPRHPWGVTVLLHLFPGVVLTLFYLLTGRLFAARGLPPLWGLLLGIPLVLVPLELGILVAVGHRVTGRLTLRGALLYTRPLSWNAYLTLVPLTLLASTLLPGLGVWLEPSLHAHVFPWLPAWFSAGLGGLSSYSPAVQVLTLGMWLLFATVLGPITEELYFRGYLLPRLPLPGSVAPLVNALLFSVYHFWQPYAWLTVVLFALPLAYLVKGARNVYLGMMVHCTVNLITFVGLVMGVMAR